MFQLSKKNVVISDENVAVDRIKMNALLVRMDNSLEGKGSIIHVT